MYVYIQTEPSLWTVGFYDPQGEWHGHSDHDDRQSAARRVAWLNGNAAGGADTDAAEPADKQPGAAQQNGECAAFPGAEEWTAVGLSKREWLAAQALTAVVARRDFKLFIHEHAFLNMATIAADSAVILADALLKRLEGS